MHIRSEFEVGGIAVLIISKEYCLHRQNSSQLLSLHAKLNNLPDSYA
ncbi:MAG TPA: hypothetical protein P5270_05635 [Victivallales bacterium]|nr:hypothetical protein [Victivallales bacterium]HRR28826.1 hypothetical protein [Victivallales bacterium]